MKASDERFERNGTVGRRVCSWWMAVALCGLSFLGGAGTFALFHGVSMGPRGIAWNRFNDRAAEQSLKLGEIAVSWIEFEVMRDPVLAEWFIEQSEGWAPPEPIQSKLDNWVTMRDFHRNLLFLELGTDRWNSPNAITAKPVMELLHRLQETVLTLLETHQEARQRIQEAAAARAAAPEPTPLARIVHKGIHKE